MTARTRETRITAVLGPTNTGKTHLAIERMLARSSGVIGLPLRLLAREVYDRVAEAKGVDAAALITGEEKISPPGARYQVCTVEAMPATPDAAFVAVDEVQLAADPERGHVFTQRLLQARGREETMFLGADTARGRIRALEPDAEYVRRERFSTLTHIGHIKLTRLPRRSAVVAFSAAEVYAIAEFLRRQKGGAAVVMGGLSPRTRNAQVALYQSGEVDYIVATDAIGMGLNLDVEHVAFASLKKFDGRRRRMLRPEEISQIAGRAGRFRTDGTFGTTGDCRPLEDDVVKRVEDHDFDGLKTIYWRNFDLDFQSLDALAASLALPPPFPHLQRVRENTDEAALAAHALDDTIGARATSPAAVRRLWSACHIPDFRKTTVDQHVRLTGVFARHLLTGEGTLPNDWAGGEVIKLDRVAGDIDALAARLAHVRTWTYAANRADWFADPAHWRERARDVENRLSDALHERLTQRFVDKRTATLMRGLRIDGDFLAAVAADGDVTVEGHFIGRLNGLVFEPDSHGRELEGRALRNAAVRALRPELDRRLGEIARAAADALLLDDAMAILWRGATVARLRPGASVLSPRVALVGGEFGGDSHRQRAAQRVETWLLDEIARDLAPLATLKRAVDNAALGGLARGLAFQLAERLGSLDRRDVEDELRAMSQAERRALRAHGVRIGEYSVFLPALVRPRPSRLLSLLLAVGGDSQNNPYLPAPGRSSLPADASRSPRVYAAAGYRVCGPRAVRLDMLERLADAVRNSRKKLSARTPFPSTPEMLSVLGCSRADLAGVLRALGYRRVKTAADRGEARDQPDLWRIARRAPAKAAPKAKPAADGPFAALAVLSPAEPHRKRRARKRKRA